MVSACMSQAVTLSPGTSSRGNPRDNMSFCSPCHLAHQGKLSSEPTAGRRFERNTALNEVKRDETSAQANKVQELTAFMLPACRFDRRQGNILSIAELA